MYNTYIIYQNNYGIYNALDNVYTVYYSFFPWILKEFFQIFLLRGQYEILVFFELWVTVLIYISIKQTYLIVTLYPPQNLYPTP